MLSIIATAGQSIYDLCLMTYGDLKYVYKLIQDSNIVNLNEPTLSGKEIILILRWCKIHYSITRCCEMVW